MKTVKTLKIALMIGLVLTVCFTLSCKKSSVNTKGIVAKAIVRDAGDPAADGCGWLIQINGTDSLYSPSNLTDNFKVDSLKVNVSYTILNSKFQCGWLPGRGITQIKLGTIAKQ